jgi:hypothetical protein
LYTFRFSYARILGILSAATQPNATKGPHTNQPR